MASGVGVSEECLKTFQDLKLGKKSKYIIYKLNPTLTEIVVDKTSTDPNYETFLEDLPEAECRWAIYDFAYDLEDGGKRQKLVFVSWSPDDAKIKQKMVSASSREALKRQLTGVQVEMQATSAEEISWEAVLEKAKRFAH